MKYRVSHVEAFRRWEQDEDAEMGALIDSILGRSEPSTAMLAGTALHKVLEEAKPGLDLDTVESQGFVFHFDADMALELRPIRELRASMTWIVDGKPITISGQVDAIDGMTIEDHKSTARFDPDRFLAGCQWRLYLSIFGADRFRWNVFEIRECDAPNEYSVVAQHRLEQWRYPTMAEDCADLVARFARFVREHVETPEGVQ